VTLVAVRGLVKNYAGLRPLRLQSLDVQPGQVVSIVGLDAQAAEVFVGLLTGALLPDEGGIRLFEQSTAAVSDTEAWLAMLDGVGVITERAVLIEQFSVEQNIAMPFTRACRRGSANARQDRARARARAKTAARGASVGVAAARGGDQGCRRSGAHRESAESRGARHHG
jgi:ABC-type sugar transport system ATPase subunit